MRRIPLSTFTFTLALLCVTPFVVRADDVSRRAKCEEMLKVTQAEQMMAQMRDSMQKAQLEQLAKMELPPEARASAAEMRQRTEEIMRKTLNWQTLKPRFVDLYAATYTEPELDGILAFYRSPAGHAMLEKMPQVMLGSMRIGQEAMAAMMPELSKIVEELKQKK